MALQRRSLMDKTLKKEDLWEFIGYLKRDYEVVGPQRKVDEYVFDYIDDSAELALNYATTMLSSKKLFFPPREPLYGYEKVGNEVILHDLSEK